MAESGLIRKKITSIIDDENYIKTISHLDHETEEGNAYDVTVYSSNSVGSTTIYLQINGSSGYELHLEAFDFQVSEGLGEVTFIEASSTITSGAATVTAYNKNRTSTNQTNMTFFSDPTNVASSLTILEHFFIGSSAGSNTAPSPSAGLALSDKWIIGDSTYIIKIDLSSTATSIRVWGNLIYHEKEL
jgi:hypothetical protein